MDVNFTLLVLDPKIGMRRVEIGNLAAKERREHKIESGLKKSSFLE